MKPSLLFRLFGLFSYTTRLKILCCTGLITVALLLYYFYAYQSNLVDVYRLNSGLDANDLIKKLYIKQGVVILFCTFMTMAIVALYRTRFLYQSIENLKNGVEVFSKGDFSVRVPVTTQDEIGAITASFNQLAELWEQSINRSEAMTDRLIASASTIFEAAQKLEGNVEKQRQEVGHIEDKIRESLYNGAQFADLLRKMNKSIENTSSLAKEGTATLSAMEQITEQMVTASARMVANIDKIRHQVESIHGVIASIVAIADQSNLLSINTAIKARKAGDSGKGFVIVANTVKELTDQTAIATLDIEKAAQDIVVVMEGAVADVVDFSAQIRQQGEGGIQVNNTLKERLSYMHSQLETFDGMQRGMQKLLADSKQIGGLVGGFTEATAKTDEGAHKFYNDAKALYELTQQLHNTLR